MSASRAAVIRAFAAACAAAALSLPARAIPPTVTGTVLQCDGSFAAGNVTSHPTPTVSADVQALSTGLKIGQRRLSVIPVVTSALWRFDTTFFVSVSSCYTGGCNGGSDSCRTWTYTYSDFNGSADLEMGKCTYRDTVTGGCSNTMSLYGGVVNQNPAQVGACPGSTTTLPSGSGPLAISASGPRPGLSSQALSAEALTLNAANSNFGRTPDSTLWDLPGSYTLSAWVNASAANGRIVSQQSGTGYWGIGIGSDSKLRHFDSRDAGAPASAGDVTRGPVITGGWHMVHLVRRNGIDRRFYVDGALVGTAPANSSSTFATHPILGELMIGRYFAGSEYFTGNMDDVRVLQTALTDDDVMLEWDTRTVKVSNDSGISYSTSGGSFPAGPSNGTTGVANFVPTTNGYASTRRWIFMGQNIDSESAASSAYNVSIDNSPPIPNTLIGTPTTTNDITWSWGAPNRVCPPPGSASVFYNLVDAPSGSVLIPPGSMAYPATSVGENIGGSPNQLLGRRLKLTDNWGSGLSGATSVYTLAAPAAAGTVVPTQVTTGSALINWGLNGNPAYTRWQMNYSQNAAFSGTVSTPIAIGSNYTGSSYPVSGLTPGTTYFARVQSFSGRSTDNFGGAGSVFVSTSFTTVPNAPGLSGVAQSTGSILWSWTQQTGAQYYKLFDAAISTVYSGGALSVGQGGLSPNTQYTAYVEALSLSGPSPRASAQAFTLAKDPTAPSVFAAYSTSITYVWNANTNPGYTFYQVSVTTDATFAVVIATLTVNTTSATATGLFPATTYYARVRSVSGSQQNGNFVSIVPSTSTAVDPQITASNSPSSAYIPVSATVGLWQFDEGAGAAAADSSGFANTATVGCVAAGCASTPTFTAGPAGLGTAASFSGLDHGLVRVPDTSTYAYTGSITVEAWVNPNTLSQPSGAGVVVRGSGTAENYALDVFGGKWRWTPSSAGGAVSSSGSITVGAWTHVIGVYNSLTAAATIYVNGQLSAVSVGVPARAAASHDVTIGNRQSGLATTYNRGFIGAIDSVRVVHRALTAAEALAEYQGASVSTVTPAAPNAGILVGLPPNAFSSPATIYVSQDPVGHPISITAAALDSGLANAPTGYTLVPNSIVEIVPIVGGVPFTTPLGSSATLSIPYADANGDSIIDNTSPPLSAKAIQVFTLNTTVNRWEQLVTSRDAANKRVTAWTPHFSLFAMFAPSTIGTSLAQIRAYPIPWRPGAGDRFDAAGVTFDRLPVQGTVRILTLAGERVRELPFDGGSAGAVVWDGRNDSGRRAASGVYFARVLASDGSAAVVKFAIER